jgi:glutaredoxin
MLVKDGVVEKMFIEPQKEGDPFEVSDADTMLKHVAPREKAPEPVVIFAKAGCPHCARAKALLDKERRRLRGGHARQGHHLLHAARGLRRGTARRCSSAASSSAAPTSSRSISPQPAEGA